MCKFNKFPPFRTMLSKKRIKKGVLPTSFGTFVLQWAFIVRTKGKRQIHGCTFVISAATIYLPKFEMQTFQKAHTHSFFVDKPTFFNHLPIFFAYFCTIANNKTQYINIKHTTA